LRFYKYKFFFELLSLSIKKNFSVGFCFIVVAIASGIKPTLTGFDLDEGMGQRSHYWSSQPHPIGGYHNLNDEHKLIKLFEKNNLITILS